MLKMSIPNRMYKISSQLPASGGLRNPQIVFLSCKLDVLVERSFTGFSESTLSISTTR